MTEAHPLAARVAIVTGATGGMGRAITMALAEAGVHVMASDLGEGDDLLTAASDAGVVGELGYHAADVADSAACDALVAAAVDRFGRLDCAVNAAAVEFETVPLHQCTDADFDRMMGINVGGVFACMRAEIAAMLDTGDGGSIVNIASTNSFRPQHDQPAYTASKHAVLGLTRSAAMDYARHGIRVNAICPGAIDTPMLRSAMERRGRDAEDTAKRLSRFGRFGTPDEIASAALWLCSDASSFTTGHALAVDGGMLAS